MRTKREFTKEQYEALTSIYRVDFSHWNYWINEFKQVRPPAKKTVKLWHKACVLDEVKNIDYYQQTEYLHGQWHHYCLTKEEAVLYIYGHMRDDIKSAHDKVDKIKESITKLDEANPGVLKKLKNV